MGTSPCRFGENVNKLLRKEALEWDPFRFGHASGSINCQDL